MERFQLLKKQPSLEEEDVARGFRKIEAKYGESVEKIFVKLAGFTVAHVFRFGHCQRSSRKSNQKTYSWEV